MSYTVDPNNISSNWQQWIDYRNIDINPWINSSGMLDIDAMYDDWNLQNNIKTRYSDAFNYIEQNPWDTSLTGSDAQTQWNNFLSGGGQDLMNHYGIDFNYGSLATDPTKRDQFINLLGEDAWTSLVNSKNYEAEQVKADSLNNSLLQPVIKGTVLAGMGTGLYSGISSALSGAGTTAGSTSGATAGGTTSSGLTTYPYGTMPATELTGAVNSSFIPSGFGTTSGSALSYANYLPGGAAAWTPEALSAGWGAGSGVLLPGGATTAGTSLISNALSEGTDMSKMSIPSWLTPALQTGASLLGGIIQSDAASDAVDAQLAASREGLDYLRESRDLALSLAEPYRQASLDALGGMQAMMEPGYDITTDPGYQWRMDEGMRALESSAAARGSLESGGFARSALRYAQGLASQEYGNIYNRLATIAGYEQVQPMMNSALNYGGNAANVALNVGDARGYGNIAGGNAWANMLDQLAKIDWSSIGGD